MATSDSSERARRSWAKFLHPELIKHNLLLCGLYLTAYELLRASVVDQVRSFFTKGVLPEDRRVDSTYARDVLALNPKDTMHASSLWLQRNGALDENDVADIQRVREHRNAIAHEIPKFIADADHNVELDLLQTIQRLIAKVDRWWIRNVHMTVDPQFDGVEVEESDIQSGTMVAFDLALRMALGEPDPKTLA